MKPQTIPLAIAFLLILAACSAPHPQETNASHGHEEPAVSDNSLVQPETTDNAPTLPSGTYLLDPAQSTLTYTASRIAGTPHVGTVQLKEGEITIAQGTATNGRFVIDMTQITESKNNQRFLTHLKSKDFFDVEAYPTSTFTLASAEQKSDTEHMITGDLTILGQTHAITFPAKLSLTGNTLRANSTFTIDRTRWNITYDSGSIFSNLGDRAINDEIGYTLDLTFTAP